MESEEVEKQIFTTFIVDNLSPLELQEVEFIADKRECEAEFSNLRPVSSRNSLLWPTLTGLTVIKDKVHILKQYATLNKEDPDLVPEEPLFKESKKLESKVSIAKPRTQEARNFLGNLREILYLRYVEKVKPKQIGKMFCIRPEKINGLISHYVVNVEEKFKV